LQAEGEGFYGYRSQESREDLGKSIGLDFQTADIDNTLFGGIGRATIRLEYDLMETRPFKGFIDIGAQGKFTHIDYPSEGSFRGDSFNELLWGPYAKLGLRYSF
jgi:hypothetical protein